ncbi:unnamed protein product, partial [Rotaria sp. Silwood2]
MTGIACTKCGHTVDRTQASTQIVTKVLTDVFAAKVATATAGGVLDSFLAGAATEVGIKCPKCG